MLFARGDWKCASDEWMDRIGNHRGNWEGLWVHRESSKRLLEQYKKLQEAVLVNPGGLEENAAYDAFMKERNEKQTELIMVCNSPLPLFSDLGSLLNYS